MSHRARAFAAVRRGEAADDEPASRGFGVYVHWPFCAAKCPYCDFNSHVRHQPPDQARFAAAFARELATTADRAPGRTVSSIFLGGGTPSLMEPATVGAILDAIAAHWPVAPDVEITLEANPSSVEAERFRGYRAAGVNRVSLGVQALNDADLRFLGRLHNVAEARAAIETRARDLPAPLLRPDLCPPRPDAGGLGGRARARRCRSPPTTSRSTSSPSRPARPSPRCTAPASSSTPDEDTAAALYAATHDTTATRPACRPTRSPTTPAPGAECRHNLVYWRYGEYAGIGPGAHGRLVLARRPPRHRDREDARRPGWRRSRRAATGSSPTTSSTRRRRATRCC